MQTVDIAAVIDAAPDGSRVLVGDFNARPTTTEMVPIYTRFLDAWLEAGVPAPDNSSGNTSPARLAGNPTSRIDYNFVSAQVTVAAAYVPIDPRTRLAAAAARGSGAAGAEEREEALRVGNGREERHSWQLGPPPFGSRSGSGRGSKKR
jgi:hypothetical protein